MSAETIPSDVPDDVWAIADAETRRGVWLPRGEVAQAIVRAILTDRSTRPAEPAAPVAEAGDDRVCMCGALEKDHSAYDGHSFVDMEKHQTAQDQAERWGYSQGHTKGFEEGGRIERKRADFLEAELEKANATLEAERARADELHWKRDFWENRGNKAFQRLAAAEQRAADALARAEKAEEALETAQEDERDRLYQQTMIAFNHSGYDESFRTAGIVLERWGAILPAARAAARSASREGASK